MEFVWEIRISSLYIHILYVKIRIAFEMDAMLYRMCSGELIGKWVLGSVFRVFKEIHSIFLILIFVVNEPNKYVAMWYQHHDRIVNAYAWRVWLPGFQMLSIQEVEPFTLSYA